MLDDEDDDDFDEVFQNSYSEGYYFAREEFREGLEFDPGHFDEDDYSLAQDAWWEGYIDFWHSVMDIEYE